MVRGVMQGSAAWDGIEAAVQSLLQWADNGFAPGKIATHD
jgi:hypothetical protein